MLREWEPLALRQYRSAIEADVRAVHQDGVLEDLVHIAAAYGGTEHREASALIADAYADEALAAIEHELELARGQGELEAVARMETLRDGVMGGRSR
jgi:hypothetical protein